MDTAISLDERLQGTRWGHFWRELFGNSIHFPLANIFLELLLRGPRAFLAEPDPYLILGAAVVQALVLSRGKAAWPLLGNLIGPALYTLVDVSLDGAHFAAGPHHWAYWGFAFAIGGFQQLRLALPAAWRWIAILGENLARTSIILAMYIILEFLQGDYHGLGGFLRDPPHQFITGVLFFLGLVLGLAYLNSERYLTVLQETAQQLRQYSEWLFGRDLLSRAVRDPSELSLARHERAVLFVDIRGFTAWSENHEPEAVVELINAYYAAGEPWWQDAIKVKLTADEIMAVFATVPNALAAGQAMLTLTGTVLTRHSLNAGAGLHWGSVVEGLMGGRDNKAYDLLGDTVNTAKRLCDAARGGELLVSETALQQASLTPEGECRTLRVKGKSETLRVYPVKK